MDREDVHKLLWEHNPDAAVFTNEKARIQVVNPAAATLFGISEKELLGKNVLHLFSDRRGDPDRRTMPALLEKDGQIADYKAYIMRSDGTRLAVSLNVTGVRERGRVVGYFGTVRNVTNYIIEIYTDSLTGLGNRRAFESALRGEVTRAIVERRPLGLLWVDLDEFKRRNALFGYDVCDKFLQLVARSLIEIVPPVNPFYPRVFRWGGDEEPILFNSPEGVCMQLAYEIREEISRLRVPVDEDALTATASIGVAMLSDVDMRGTPEVIARELARKAGRAVYAAKDGGRDTVARWGPGMR